MIDIELEEVGTFDGVLEEDERIVSYGIGPGGDALGLAVRAVDADAPFPSYEQPGWATFPKPRAEHAYTAALVRVSGSDADRTALDGLTTTFPMIQPLPDGEILLVGSRAERRPDGSHDLNASVLGPDGTARREFLLGDGIEDVQTAADGRIWVSYFDEGVFGNFGWGEPGAPAPIGSSGLVRWLSDGTVDWSFEAPPGLDYIADCYALNVAGDAVWACYYTEFPLVPIAVDDSIESWTTPVGGARALAIGEGRAAFYGGYSDDRHRCLLLEFEGAHLVERARVQLLSSSVPLDGQTVIGRDSFLHVFDGPRWHRLDIRTLEGV